jgi:hypothetical protein
MLTNTRNALAEQSRNLANLMRSTTATVNKTQLLTELGNYSRSLTGGDAAFVASMRNSLFGAARTGGRRANITGQEALAVKNQLSQMIRSAPNNLAPRLRNIAARFNRELGQNIPGYNDIARTKVALQHIEEALKIPRPALHVSSFGYVHGRTIPAAIGGLAGALIGHRTVGGYEGTLGGMAAGAAFFGGPGGLAAARGMASPLPTRALAAGGLAITNPRAGTGFNQPPSPERQRQLQEDREKKRKAFEALPAD